MIKYIVQPKLILSLSTEGVNISARYREDIEIVILVTFLGVENIILLDGGWQMRQEKENEAYKNETFDLSLDNLAYIVYSSGTTGRPKGMKTDNRVENSQDFHQQLTTFSLCIF